jgi:hypothetical protein
MRLRIFLFNSQNKGIAHAQKPPFTMLFISDWRNATGERGGVISPLTGRSGYFSLCDR